MLNAAVIPAPIPITPPITGTTKFISFPIKECIHLRAAWLINVRQQEEGEEKKVVWADFPHVAGYMAHEKARAQLRELTRAPLLLYPHIGEHLRSLSSVKVKGRPLHSGSACASSSVLLSHIKDNVEVLDMLIRVPSVWWNPTALTHSQALGKTKKSDPTKQVNQNLWLGRQCLPHCVTQWHRVPAEASHVNTIGDQLLSLSDIAAVRYRHYSAPSMCATTAA